MIDKYTEKRPWGKFEKFCENEVCTVKLLYVSTGERLSLQKHEKRDEFWKIISGKAEITVGDDIKEAVEGDEFFVAKKTNHRIKAIDDVKILEISFGEFDERDIERLEDEYDRG